MELQSKGSVLLVEDHQDIAELVYDYMEDVGYELDYAPDGEVGINLVAQNEYDAIILDLMLPRRDGLSMCRELREKMGKTTPVLMLTARDTLEDKLKGFGYKLSLRIFLYEFCSTKPTSDIFSENSLALPSKIGISSLSISIIRLSILFPETADKICSTVFT